MEARKRWICPYCAPEKDRLQAISLGDVKMVRTGLGDVEVWRQSDPTGSRVTFDRDSLVDVAAYLLGVSEANK